MNSSKLLVSMYRKIWSQTQVLIRRDKWQLSWSRFQEKQISCTICLFGSYVLKEHFFEKRDKKEKTEIKKCCDLFLVFFSNDQIAAGMRIMQILFTCYQAWSLNIFRIYFKNSHHSSIKLNPKTVEFDDCVWTLLFWTSVPGARKNAWKFQAWNRTRFL